jgi:hypothetical protein
MAGTGILIASHGAALVNTMYLPAHAVVIGACLLRGCCERTRTPPNSPLPHPLHPGLQLLPAEIFPYLLHFTMYKELAEAANLFYYRVRTARPTPEQNVPGFEVFDEQAFQKVRSRMGVPEAACVCMMPPPLLPAATRRVRKATAAAAATAAAGSALAPSVCRTARSSTRRAWMRGSAATATGAPSPSLSFPT